ncbi:peptide/nickel transport system permease protein/glutathione transport system permease protein [Aminobacter aminovorans]|uniref:Glutathione transport system permease protein gsiD n=1 Tax=Aminobacter aminovorans TaxID=83263 RepID=A0A380WN70_AMIAI|nr:ABC transporter permease [Aminobacter aminovorans]TCS25948.1 peptide/nickel transport system permease protein/glutathione transport system permease protein [Aminobacter aminovorans]SUU90387.1 Glutathione transport system permease protein gsiD [Aminobacter aminovorans]
MSTDTTALQAANTAGASRPHLLRRLARDPLALIALIFLVVIVVAAILAPVLAPFDPYDTNLRMRLRPPGGDHLLGTDTQGRDLLTRLLYGARTTLALGFASIVVGSLIGTSIGLAAAFYRRLEGPLMRLVDILLSFPSILFGLALAAMLGVGMDSLVIALGLSAAPPIARVARATAASVMQAEYMDAGRVIGLSDSALIRRYLLRNCAAPIVVYCSLQFGETILLAAALGFLGLGLQPPTAELGSIAAEGRSFIFLAPHVSTAASLLIFMIVLSCNLLGDAFRDLTDPKLQR